MMIYPPVTELVKKTGSRYALVVETAKRARQLVDGSLPLSTVDTTKEVTMAVNEIYEDKIGVIVANTDADDIETKISAIKAAVAEANNALSDDGSDNDDIDSIEEVLELDEEEDSENDSE